MRRIQAINNFAVPYTLLTLSSNSLRNRTIEIQYRNMQQTARQLYNIKSKLRLANLF